MSLNEIEKEDLEDKAKIIEENTLQPEDFEDEDILDGWADSDNDLI